MPTPTLTTLHRFAGADGALPEVAMIADAAGNLFGVTSNGGSYGDIHGAGTVFELSGPDHQTLTTLHSFTGGADGAVPISTLFADAAGNLFGTTFYGGSTAFSGGSGGAGTVFELSGADHQTLTTLYSFSGGADGSNPAGRLVADAAGNLFGIAQYGGSFGAGTVFELSGADHQTMTILYTFSGDADGGNPYGGLFIDAAGNLFGTTTQGGSAITFSGTVFELSGADHQTLTTLHTFNSTDGEVPVGALVADAAGNLFGATYGGGAHNNGSVFELSGADHQTLTTLHSFTGDADGGQLIAGLIADANGNLFGTTGGGGSGFWGTVFKLSGADHQTLTTLYSFTSDADGLTPEAGLVADAAGNLYGATTAGGGANLGTLYEITGSGYVLPSISITAPASPSRSATQTVTGHTNLGFAGSTVTLYEGTHQRGTATVAADGSFSATIRLSGEGEHAITASHTDAHDTTITSDAVTFTRDTVKPVVAITTPALTTIQPHQLIAGTGEAHTTVSIYDNSVLLGSTSVDGTGHWSYAATLHAGNNNLVAKDTDAAGNVGSSAKVAEKLLAPDAAGKLTINADLTLTDADFAGLTGLKALSFTGHGASSVTLGANAAADFGSIPIKVSAAASVLSLSVDGSALSAPLSLKGSAGNDSFIGGAGNDIFTLGVGSDTVDVSRGGLDIITDFDVAHDMLRYTGHSMADLHISYGKGNAVVSLDATHQVTLQHIAAGALTGSEFLFV